MSGRSGRTWIHITTEQRKKLDALRRAERKSLAELVREAIDSYLLAREDADLVNHFERTVGTIPDLEVPSRDEWDRNSRWA